MGKFVHQYTRLNTTITQSIRYFLIEKEVNKWFGDVINIENKTGGSFNLKLSFEDNSWISNSIIIEKEFEKLLKLDFQVPESMKQFFEYSVVDIFFMLGTAKTEYCTEIHVIHKGFLLDENTLEFFNRFWKEKLEVLRKHFNGDWIIEDRDLILSVLKGGL